jgi:hypothetical protein
MGNEFIAAVYMWANRSAQDARLRPFTRGQEAAIVLNFFDGHPETISSSDLSAPIPAGTNIRVFDLKVPNRTYNSVIPGLTVDNVIPDCGEHGITRPTEWLGRDTQEVAIKSDNVTQLNQNLEHIGVRTRVRLQDKSDESTRDSGADAPYRVCNLKKYEDFKCNGGDARTALLSVQQHGTMLGSVLYNLGVSEGKASVWKVCAMHTSLL